MYANIQESSSDSESDIEVETHDANRDGGFEHATCVFSTGLSR
jgi:hypothetical protein